MNTEVVTQEISLYPWLKESFHQLINNPIPNSLLIYGEKDIGKLNLAIYIANYLICENSNDNGPCHHCNACNWFLRANHPDFFAILPEDSYHLLPFDVDEENLQKSTSEDKKPSKYIRIDQVRDVISVNELGSYRGGKRVILIYPVESMRMEAANSLLKSLEEPNSKVIYLLVTHQLDGILPTIRSRCRLLGVPKPPVDISLDWLSSQEQFQKIAREELKKLFFEVGRSPLKLISPSKFKPFNSKVILDELSREGVLVHRYIVESLSQFELKDILTCLQKWCIDLYMVYPGLEPRYYPQYKRSMLRKVAKINYSQLGNFLQFLIRELKLSSHPLFPKIQLEAILTKYSQLFR